MKNNNNFLQQTHFVGVLLPEDITQTLEDCRHYMHNAFGCKSGYATPIHVTLVPPFCLPDEYTTEDLAQGIFNEIASKKLAFTAAIKNFDAFGDRTLFAKIVQDEKWNILRDAVYHALKVTISSSFKKDTRPFCPHLTVANRDIPFGAITKSLQIMNELNLVENFLVDNVTIFERVGKKWENAFSIEISK